MVRIQNSEFRIQNWGTRIALVILLAILGPIYLAANLFGPFARGAVLAMAAALALAILGSTLSGEKKFQLLILEAAVLVLTAATVSYNIANLNGIRYEVGFSGGDPCVRIAAAISDLPSTGGTVIGQGGDQRTCSVNPFTGLAKPVVLRLGVGTLTLDTIGWTVPSTASGTWIIGEGMYTSRLVLPSTATYDAVTFDGVGGPPSGITDIGITGDGYNATQQALYLKGVTSFVVSRVWLDSTQNGLLISEGSDIAVSDSVAELCGTGFQITDTMSTITLNGLRTYRNLTAGVFFNAAKAVTDPVHRGKIIASNLELNEDLLNGIWVNSYSDIVLSAVGIGSVINPQPNTGIRVTNSQRISIDSPTITHMQQHGIVVETTSTHITISNPQIDAIGTFSSVPALPMQGIFVEQGSKWVNIIGGSINRTQGSGISFGASGSIIGTQFVDTTLNNSATQGQIALEITLDNADTVDSVQIIGNKFINTSGTIPRGTAIKLTGGNNLQVAFNNVEGGFSTPLDNPTGGSNRQIFGNVGITNASYLFGLNVVTFSATPTFDASLGNTQKITLTGNVTSSTLSNATAGETIDFIICQDSGGSHTFVWPTNVKGAMTIGSTLSTCSAQSFRFDGTSAYALTEGKTNM